MKILVINPGSTSTKIGLFIDTKKEKELVIRHDQDELNEFQNVLEQLDFRLKQIDQFLDKEQIDLEDIDGYIARGGLIKPVESGIYQVNKKMLKDLKSATYGEHASNLGAIIANYYAEKYNKKAYIADPVVVDEMSTIAKISGLNGISRNPIWHALNQKAVARRYAKKVGSKYEDLNLIVAHLGGGISVGYHKRGRVTDVNNALDGDGPFSPERTGGLPVSGVYELAFSGDLTLDQMRKINHGFGGLYSYLNTSNAEEVSDMIASGHILAKRILKAMVYQIAKEIGGLYAITRGHLDAIIITGGLAYNQDVLQPLLEYIDHIGEIVVYPGEDELEALAYNYVRMENKEIPLKKYE
jgi:butyrate kinase